jgi:hypothetical protein
MKCSSNNSCPYNPKRHREGQEIARSYTRQPVRDSDHGNCPFRINGMCESVEHQIVRIKNLRSLVKSLRDYRNKIKGYVQIEYNQSDIDNLFKMFKGFFINITNPVSKIKEFWYKPPYGVDIGFKGGEIGKFLNGIVEYQISKIKDYDVPVSLLKGFDRVIMERGEIRLFAELKNFNDQSIFNYDKDDDEENIWYQKEIQKGIWKVRIFIRETRPFRKEGELNTER